MNETMKQLLNVFLLQVICFTILCNAKSLDSDISQYIQVCHKKDPKLNDCIKASIEQLCPLLAAGIEGLLIPPCDPLQIPKVEIKQNAGAIRMDSEYLNIMINGLSDFVIRNVDLELMKNRFQIDMWFPELRMAAEYNIYGKLLLMPLSGHGTCTGNFTDIDASVFIETDRVMINDREHLKVNNLIVEFNMGGADVRMNDLFNGDTELCEAMNSFLNENWKSVAAEMQPALKDAITNILLGVTERLFNTFSIEQILPD